MLLPGARQVTVALNAVQDILLPIRKYEGQGKRERMECIYPFLKFFIGPCHLSGPRLIPAFLFKTNSYGFFLRVRHYSKCFTHITHLIMTINL